MSASQYCGHCGGFHDIADTAACPGPVVPTTAAHSAPPLSTRPVDGSVQRRPTSDYPSDEVDCRDSVGGSASRNEQPQGEPVAWMIQSRTGIRTFHEDKDVVRSVAGDPHFTVTPIYARESVPASERALWVEYVGLMAETRWALFDDQQRTRVRELQLALGLDDQNRDVRS